MTTLGYTLSSEDVDLAREVADRLGGRTVATAESVVTSECACQMALGAAQLFRAGVAVATTGVAGGDETEGTPPGTVYIATAVGDFVSANEYHFDGTSEEICDQAKRRALRDLASALS